MGLVRISKASLATQLHVEISYREVRLALAQSGAICAVCGTALSHRSEPVDGITVALERLVVNYCN
jgi:hypothetical protein